MNKPITKKDPARASKKVGDVYTALSEFQQDCPTIFKGETGYGYKFADLARIVKVINPILHKHGLTYTQPIKGSELHTIIVHPASGTTIESWVDLRHDVSLKGQNVFQIMGSQITYNRRYLLASILGLITDSDQDAQGQQTNPEKTKKAPAKPKKLLNASSFRQLLKSYGQEHNGRTIDMEWIRDLYALTPEQEKTIEVKASGGQNG